MFPFYENWILKRVTAPLLLPHDLNSRKLNVGYGFLWYPMLDLVFFFWYLMLVMVFSGT